MIKQKLDISQMSHDYFDETFIMGIIAPIKNYYFVWMLNNFLDLDFALSTESNIVLHKKNRIYHFNLYKALQPELNLVHLLFHNQCDGEPLLPELKHFDFIWLMKGNGMQNELGVAIAEKIKPLNQVQLVTEIIPDQIKNISNLII
ncbi:IPExxxVDY family protein [Hydrotalea sandarakina]|jgi:hypothetical protein|uniref:IPExxxVDY family protein n=1 Tax=Hydrotalea sandarakina TaxID=1004304 RepID=A0A2W7RID0_9BACT|nr:IPExxxVDY family protein [Hydrotalea sandarakina]PZX60643.1 hypothetical protein LX80_02420 [Hydrotalea sandarakina]